MNLLERLADVRQDIEHKSFITGVCLEDLDKHAAEELPVKVVKGISVNVFEEREAVVCVAGENETALAREAFYERLLVDLGTCEGELVQEGVDLVFFEVSQLNGLREEHGLEIRKEAQQEHFLVECLHLVASDEVFDDFVGCWRE